MASLLERLRAALAPRYDVERQLGDGGMGVVFLGRDRRLDRPVAIKLLRPELATAYGATRFVRESRILSRHSHPNIVPVHDADEADGLSYYVMDFVEGETLERRLERGPLTRDQALRLGRDLLAALEATHAHGIVHRDIKPGNIFLLDDRAMLTDFGVARTISGDEGLTQPGAVIGTPGYMPPEQLVGKEATPRTDLYAVGMVVFEALTGRAWDLPSSDDSADWTGVPRDLVPVLRRALAWDAAARWSDAAAFRRALTRAGGEERRGRWARALQALALLGGIGLVAAILGRWFGPAPPESPERIRVARFPQVGGAAQPWLADSVARHLARALSGNPDFRVVGPDEARETRQAGLVLGGTVRVQQDTVCVQLVLHAGAAERSLTAHCGPAAEWRVLAESQATPALRQIWVRSLMRDLPVRALPRTGAGLDAFLAAERLFGHAQWEAAYEAYLAAEAVDSTCWLCSWRIHDVERWLGVPHDPLRTVRYLAHVDSFPPQYAVLMRASAAPIAERIEMERQAAERHAGSALAWWALGDDLFHRGPLLGRSRRDALVAFEQAAALRPDFAPAWEHLALVRIAEGNREGAASALRAWLQSMHGRPRDGFSTVVEEWLKAGLAWRFRPGDAAEAVVERALRVPEVAGSHLLPAGPRLLIGNFDAPEGAIWLGRRFVEWPERPDLGRTGLVGQALGYIVLGQPDSARARLRQLRERYDEPELRLFAVELETVLVLVDPAPVAAWHAEVLETSRRYAAPGALESSLAARAAGMAALLLDQEGAAEAGRFGAASTGAFRTLLAARGLARNGQWQSALNSSLQIDADTAAHRSDPVLRALVRLGRAEWFARDQNPEAARRELRWAEHSDVRGYPTGIPQAADVDWSLRTIARWRLATTLDAAGQSDDEVCRAYHRVARAWSAGAPVYRARADSARGRAGALGCRPAL